MKKVLFVLGAFAAMSLVACSGKTDCACDLVNSTGELPTIHSTDADVNGTLDVLEFDGDCKDVKWTDLKTSSKDWPSLAALGYTLTCAEK